VMIKGGVGIREGKAECYPDPCWKEEGGKRRNVYRRKWQLKERSAIELRNSILYILLAARRKKRRSILILVF